MSLNLPVLWPFRMTPNLLMCRVGSCDDSEKGPNMRPRLHSLCRYSEMISGCWSADSIFEWADFNGDPYWKPILKPQRSPWQMYRA